MAYAKKCDRCGKLYEKQTPKLQTIGEFKTYGISWTMDIMNKEIDLCPGCEESFKNWFEKVGE